MAYGDGVDEGHAEGEEQFHFYYNREERLKNAPKLVQDYYSGNFKLNKGFRALVANRGNRFLLVTLVLCLILVGFTSLFASFEKGNIGELNFTLSSFSFEEEIYVSLKINSGTKRKTKSSSKKDKLQQIPVEVVFSAFDVDKQLSSSNTVSGNFNGEEFYLRTKFADYDILTVHADISALNQTCTLKASVQRK